MFDNSDAASKKFAINNFIMVSIMGFSPFFYHQCIYIYMCIFGQSMRKAKFNVVIKSSMVQNMLIMSQVGSDWVVF